MTVTSSPLLFVLAALAAIGGRRLIWREHRGLWWVAASGVIALGVYGFGRILAAGSLAWSMVVDRYRPARWEVIGGVAPTMYAPWGRHG